MAANPIAIVHDGIVEIPSEVKADPRFQNGSRLTLVPVPPLDSEAALGKEPGDWRRLQGILADSHLDPNVELEAEKQRELATETTW